LDTLTKKNEKKKQTEQGKKMEEIVQRGLVPLEHPAIVSAIAFQKRFPADDVNVSTTTKRAGLSLSFSRPVDQMLAHNTDLSSATDDLSCEFIYAHRCSVQFTSDGRIWMPETRNSTHSVNFDTLELALSHFAKNFGPDSCCHCACKGNACCHCKKRKTSSLFGDE